MISLLTINPLVHIIVLKLIVNLFFFIFSSSSTFSNNAPFGNMALLWVVFFIFSELGDRFQFAGWFFNPNSGRVNWILGNILIAGAAL